MTRSPSTDQPGDNRPGQTDEKSSAGPEQPRWTCDICGTVMLDTHCKLKCLACGYTRDCSDPWDTSTVVPDLA